jgi:hypothetical protein
MPEETNQPSNIVSTKDLGNGRKEVTFSVDASKINEYFDSLHTKDGVKFDSEFHLGKGSVINRYDAPQYRQFYNTSTEVPYTQALKTPTDPHKKIQLAVDLYHKEPIVGTVIDLMADFSSSGYTNECDDGEIKKLYDKWAEEVKIAQLLEGIFLEYYRSGNVTIYRSDKKATVKKSKKSSSGTETTQYDFPAGYTILNPMNVIVDGSLLFNQEIIQLQLNAELINLVKSKDAPKKLLAEIPTDIVKAIRSGNGLVVLSPEHTSRITRKRQPYERYATPFLERVFEPILYKQKLRMMDMSTIEGLINQLVTVTVGDKDFPATDDDLKAIAELFQTPNKAYTIFWNHTLQVTFHKPEGIDTLTADKYKAVNDDILAGIGVSRVLLDGQGANFSTAWVSILSLIERLENARAKVKDWLEGEYKRIAEENGFKTYPKVRFNRMNLREDTYIRDVLLAMYDRGLIDEEDILVETGRDYEAVIEMKKRNEKNSSLFLPPEQPFQGNQTSPSGGRPTGTGGNYSKRKTAPVQNNGKPPKPKTSKATASYANQLEDYESELANYYEMIQEQVLSVVEENKDEDESVIKAIIAGIIISMFKTMSVAGDKAISDIFDGEISNYHTGFDRNSQKVKADLQSWNSSYINKLANDIREESFSDNTDDIVESVARAFEANKFRVSMIATNGITESLRQAKIQGNALAGKQTAVWRSALADNTCNTCRGLHGQQFKIADIPSRPHANCQCDLDFI